VSEESDARDEDVLVVEYLSASYTAERAHGDYSRTHICDDDAYVLHQAVIDRKVSHEAEDGVGLDVVDNVVAIPEVCV
jgi:hypothetical protein